MTRASSTGSAIANGLAMSHDGNTILVTGSFSSTLKSPTSIVWATSNTNTVFVAGLGVKGSLLWLRSASSSLSSDGVAVVSLADGFVVTGTFNGNVAFGTDT